MAKFYEILGTHNPERCGDVIFVHGLDGNATSTWRHQDKPEAFWPQWLGEDLPQVGVWSLEYDAASIAWKGSAMPLADRATNVLALMEAHGLGKRPLVFVAHSLGGLLVKQMLRHAMELGQAQWQGIARQTRGIVFLATPHSGSNIANWLQYLSMVLRTNATIQDLKAHDPQLRHLNLWFRNNIGRMDLKCDVYFETQTVAKLLVVDESSADPGIAGVIPIPVDGNHIDICKPASKHSLTYMRTLNLIKDRIPSRAPEENANSAPLKYFYYISKNKVEMLGAQISGKGPEGASPQRNEVGTAAGKLVKDTEAVIAGLAGAGLLPDLHAVDQISPSKFYRDTGEWRSGLFAMNWMGDTPTVVYALYRSLKDALILLVGSPNNILGDKVVSSEYFVPGSSGAQIDILEYVAEMFKVDEPVAVTEGRITRYGYRGKMPERSSSPILNPFRDDDTLHRHDRPRGPRFMHVIDEDEKGLSLATLCLSQLSQLPTARMDLAFRIFSRHPISIPNDQYDREYWARFPELEIDRYKAVYLGSPIYTALD